MRGTTDAHAVLRVADNDLDATVLPDQQLRALMSMADEDLADLPRRFDAA